MAPKYIKMPKKKAKKDWESMLENARTAKARYEILNERRAKLLGGRAVGGISLADYAQYTQEGAHDPFIWKNYGIKVSMDAMPKMALEARDVVFDSGGRITKNKKFTASQQKQFGAATVKNGIKTFIWPKYWQNPYQYQDYIILQDNYANTQAGRIIDVITYFTLGKGIKPKLKPKDTKMFKNDAEMQKAIQAAEWVVDVFKQIDDAISRGDDPKPFGEWDDAESNYIPPYSDSTKAGSTYDSPLNSKWRSACTLALTYGRGAVVPNINPDDNEVMVRVANQTYKFMNIPKILQLIHPRDLGFNHVDPQTWKLLGIQLYNSNWILKPSQMIFFEWNANNPVYGALYYGYSAMQSMIGAARTLRRIIEVDFPLIAKTRWSGMYWMFFKRKGEGLITSEEEHNAILERIRLDGFNISLEDDPINDVRVEKIDLDPKIHELIELCRFNIEYMMSQVGMPQGLMFGENDLNRDTMRTSIKAFINGPIRNYRAWFTGIVGTQYYARMAETVKAQNPKIAEVLEWADIVADIEEFDLDDWTDLVEMQNQLEQFGAFTPEERGKNLHIDNYPSKLDPNAEIPAPISGGRMNVTAPDGRRYEVE